MLHQKLSRWKSSSFSLLWGRSQEGDLTFYCAGVTLQN